VSFLLDTNVLSETKRRRGDARVKQWFGSASSSLLYTSVVVIGEIRRGVESLRRHDAGQAAIFDQWLSELKEKFADRVLLVTTDIAEEWGRLNVPDPLPTIDAYLAATAKVHGLTLVTRNTRDLQRTGVALLDPWTGG
jgi:predicted nucleic acid-binding protein